MTEKDHEIISLLFFFEIINLNLIHTSMYNTLIFILLINKQQLL